MAFERIALLIVCAFTGGLILGVHLLSKRAIHVTNNVRAEAHGHGGNTASVSPGEIGWSGVGGFFGNLFNTLKWLAVAAVCALVVFGLFQKNTPAPITVNVPAAPPVTVNLPKTDPPVVTAPPATVPVITVPPIAGVPPIVLVLLLSGVIILGVMILIAIRHQTSPSQTPAPETTQRWIELEPGHYTPLALPSASPSVGERPISAAEYDDLFNKRTTVKRA